ncbi:MAG: TIGR03086 family protein [Mycobacteriaceae bacterium]|nr:TIGR03086 family protein [Mycobacteriaceae bacterium]
MPYDVRPGPHSPPADELSSAEDSFGVLLQVIHLISADDLSRQTPCTQFDVAQLTDHLMNSITVIGSAVGAQLPPRDATDSVERQIVALARPTLDAWHAHGLTGMVMLGPNEAPAAVVIGILSIEFLVHAWDYATALGRTLTASDALNEYVLGLAEQIITANARADVGFADPVVVSPDATPLDRLIAFTGRNRVA